LRTRTGPVVINCSSSRMSNDICLAHDCELHLSAVGEANVTNLMKELNAVYGGEGNGGPIDPKVGYVRDSFVAMAQVLDAMAANDKTVSQLAAEIPRYEIHKTTVQIDRKKISQLYAELKIRYPDAKASELDGLRLDWEDRWMLVRPSNTEPIVRAIAEAKDLKVAKKLCESVAELAKSVA